MKRQQRIEPIGAGDRVCYRSEFLRSIGVYTGEMPQARGIVNSLSTLGSIQIAEINWGELDLPQKVNTANLSRVSEFGILDR